MSTVGRGKQRAVGTTAEHSTRSGRRHQVTAAIRECDPSTTEAIITKGHLRTFLVVQQLGLCASTAGAGV